jgi:hypothetical protein
MPPPPVLVLCIHIALYDSERSLPLGNATPPTWETPPHRHGGRHAGKSHRNSAGSRHAPCRRRKILQVAETLGRRRMGG